MSPLRRGEFPPVRGTYRGALQVDGVRTAARDARAILGELAYLFTSAGAEGQRRDQAARVVQRAIRSALDRWKLEEKAGGLLAVIGKTSKVIRRLQQIRRHAARWHDRWLQADTFSRWAESAGTNQTRRRAQRREATRMFRRAVGRGIGSAALRAWLAVATGPRSRRAVQARHAAALEEAREELTAERKAALQAVARAEEQ